MARYRNRNRNRNKREENMTEPTKANDVVETSNDITADSVLDSSKGKFEHVIVLGVTKEGLLEVGSTIHSYPFIHWHLNKATFQLNVHENNALTAAQKEVKTDD